MINSDIIFNNASFYASIGTFYFNDFNIYFYYCNISNNYGTSVGGVFAALNVGGLIHFNHCLFQNNCLDNNTFIGGAVFNLYGEISATVIFLKNCTYINNYSSKKGGVFAILYGSVFDTDSYYRNNTSSNGGVAFLFSNCVCNLTNIIFSQTQSQYGGVLSIMEASNVNIKNSIFIGNNGQNGGCIFGEGYNIELNVRNIFYKIIFIYIYIYIYIIDL